MLTLIYAWMIKLYPRKFRHTFEDEMKGVFAKALENAKLRGSWIPISLLAREMRDLPIALIRAYYHEKDWTMPPEMISLMRQMSLFFLVPICVATLCNFAQWNYLFIPPSLDPMVTKFSSVDSLSYYRFKPHNEGVGYEAINGNPARAQYGFTATPSYFFVEYDMDRVTRWAGRQGVNQITPLDEAALTQLEQIIAQLNWHVEFYITTRYIITNRVVPDLPTIYHEPTGYIVQGSDEDGNSLMLISMSSLLSDDSYGYHEAVFQLTDDDATVLATNTYNYDSAGIEFAQWPFWFLFAFLFWYLLILVGHLVAKLLNKLNNRVIVHS